MTDTQDMATAGRTIDLMAALKESLARAARGRCYFVTSPECEGVEPVLDDGSGPKVQWRDVVYVYTTSARRAKVLALRYFRRMYRSASERRDRFYLCDDTINPFDGMTVELVSDMAKWDGAA